MVSRSSGEVEKKKKKKKKKKLPIRPKFPSLSKAEELETWVTKIIYSADLCRTIKDLTGQADADTVIIAPGFSCRSAPKHFTGRTALHPAMLLRSLLIGTSSY